MSLKLPLFLVRRVYRIRQYQIEIYLLAGVFKCCKYRSMKISKLVTLLSLSFSVILSSNCAFAGDVPTTPPNPCCGGGCNDYMTQLHSDFLLLGKTPSLTPAVYSGTCRHLGQYSPDRDHHAVVLLDQFVPEASPTLESARFSAILAFFAEKNEYAEWNLETARKEMSSYWVENGLIKYGDETYRVVINDENQNPVLAYWMRQNPITQELYFIYYSGHAMRSFCRLEKNALQ